MIAKIAFWILAGFVVLPGVNLMAAGDCGGDAVYRLLDFWVGEWTVTQDDAVVGTNRIEKVLDGCAILEHWRGAGGGEGKSVFYVDTATKTWKQVWMTDRGPIKEKVLIQHLPGGAVRFQGEVLRSQGDRVLDRTTLTPADGTVRQLIETSSDRGLTWQKMFDGLYKRGKAPESNPAARSPAPCAAAPHRQFDFWLGTWRVENGDGTFAGTNKITSMLGGCVIHEQWTGARGVTGESFNIYDASRDVWHQTWVDSSGTLLLLDGKFADGKMVLSGTRKTPAGETRDRITWSKTGRGLQQLWDVSEDGGATWKNVFTGMYTPEK